MHDTSPINPNNSSLDLASFQIAFNKELSSFFDSKIETYKTIPNAPLFIEALEHARLLLLSGGKRIRPYICYLACVTENETQQQEIFRAGIALELFHTFALVHDDIIDKGSTRHGILTTHAFVSERAGDVPFRDVPHVSNSIALLIGDLIFSWSYELIGTLQNAEVMQTFSQMVSEVVAGQAFDVSFMLATSVSMKDILEKNELKTARYTFVNPMQIGRALAKSTLHADTYTELGLALGQAFQMQDDLIDVTGKVAVTGKEPFIDVQDGQHTLLTQYIFDNSNEADRQALRAVFGKKLSVEDRAMLAHLFVDTGAIEYAHGEIATLLDRAQSCVVQLPETYQGQWNNIIALLRARVS